jgi:hypothetical protein
MNADEAEALANRMLSYAVLARVTDEIEREGEA